jgi:hypothetical protein
MQVNNRDDHSTIVCRRRRYLILHFDPGPNGTEVVAQMRHRCGLYAREYLFRMICLLEFWFFVLQHKEIEVRKKRVIKERCFFLL